MAARTTRSARRGGLRRADPHGRTARESRTQTKPDSLAQIGSGKIGSDCSVETLNLEAKSWGMTTGPVKPSAVCLMKRSSDTAMRSGISSRAEKSPTSPQTNFRSPRAWSTSFGRDEGDKVAIWMAGHAEWAFVYFALARIGAIMVPVNTRYRPDEIKYVLNKSKASLLVFKEEANKDYLGLLKQLFSGGEFAGNLPNETLPFLRALIVASDRRIDGCLDLDELIAAGKAVPEKELLQAASEVTGDDIAMLQFTSGTTAMPKAAKLFHGAMLRGAWCGCEVLQLSEADRFFSPQPFFHVGGSIQVMLTPIISGCRMIVQPYFDAGQALELMERHRCNVLMGHQPHYIEYLNHPDLKARNLGLEKGMILSPEVNKRVYDQMGIKKLISPYGLTETHIGGTACALDDPWKSE